MARASGKAVFTLDYVDDKQKIADCYRDSRALGYRPYVTKRGLDRITVNTGWDEP